MGGNHTQYYSIGLSDVLVSDILSDFVGGKDSWNICDDEVECLLPADRSHDRVEDDFILAFEV